MDGRCHAGLIKPSSRTNGGRFGRIGFKRIAFERILAELLASPRIARVLESSHHVKVARRREGPPPKKKLRKNRLKRCHGTFELFVKKITRGAKQQIPMSTDGHGALKKVTKSYVRIFGFWI